jgi:hypothetical protein
MSFAQYLRVFEWTFREAQLSRDPTEPRPLGSRSLGIVKSLFGSGYAGLGSGSWVFTQIRKQAVSTVNKRMYPPCRKRVPQNSSGSVFGPRDW